MPQELVALVAQVKPDNPGLRDVASRIARSGNAEAIRKAGERLVAAAERVGGAAFRAEKKAEIDAANRTAGVQPPPDQIERRIDALQAEKLDPIFGAMEEIGGESVTDYALREASNGALPLERRVRALRIAERHVAASDADRSARKASAKADVDRVRLEQMKADPMADTASAVASLQGGLDGCYQAALKKDPKLEVRGLLTLVIGPKGAVDEVKTVDVAPPDLVTCVEKAARGAKFPPPSDGKQRNVRVPITFRRN